MPAQAERRAARERALELLYEAHTKGIGAADVVDGLPLAPDEYATTLALGVDGERDDLDEVIRRHVRGDWSLARMPVLDLTILRIATFELRHSDEVPTAVAIDEAVDLAKEFSTDDSGRFVNGVLGAIARELRP